MSSPLQSCLAPQVANSSCPKPGEDDRSTHDGQDFETVLAAARACQICADRLPADHRPCPLIKAHVSAFPGTTRAASGCATGLAFFEAQFCDLAAVATAPGGCVIPVLSVEAGTTTRQCQPALRCGRPSRSEVPSQVRICLWAFAVDDGIAAMIPKLRMARIVAGPVVQRRSGAKRSNAARTATES